MAIEPILALIVVAVLANLIVMAVLVLPSFTSRPTQTAIDERIREVQVDRAMAAAAVVGGMEEGAHDLNESTRTYDRVVRIVSWAFLLVTAVLVLVTGLWSENQAAILALLAVGGVFVLVVHDLLPEEALGPAKFVVEGSVAITLATLLVALTGGVASPFFFTFPLIVGGAALVVAPTVTAALAATASFGYVLAVAVGSPPGSPVSATIAHVGINIVALLLLVYVATVIARDQRRSRDAAIRLSTIDPLTGLFNRGVLLRRDRARDRAQCPDRAGFCLLMMDLDELKVINDRAGHFHGDRVLRAVGEVIDAGVRRIDTAARYGGDEFVVLLPETDPTGAYVLAEKIRIGVREIDLVLPDAPDLRPSLSIGVVSYPDDGISADALMISADKAMYASKRAGKNRVTGVAVPVGNGGAKVASRR